ncbi:FAD/FMN-containing dehydrogenase [Pseudomonas putida]|uniref:FAD/FMN-containing dehydrogenase n=1 Tax=Pseudomonas putida TaxID=303 RepID=UPI002B251BBC|nr:FAD/FMN-containing dehydrogenase [Pseudomonas putida]
MKYAVALLFSLLPLVANALQTGEKLAPWTLLDQHDQPYTLDASTHVLLVARDMDGAKLVKAALAEQPKGYLESRDAVFVADIQRMPALISKLFAIPAMRDYNYRVMLDREGQVASRYPGQEGKVLWLQLEQGALVSLQEFADAKALKAALEKAQASKSE